VTNLVSVIVPVYNRPHRVVNAVESVVLQSHRPIEIIIVDDGSTDTETSTVIGKLEKEHSDIMHVIHQNNAGPGVARETGRKVAEGAYIQYLDSDDVLLPGKFQKQILMMQQHPECGFAMGLTQMRGEDGHVSRNVRYGRPTIATLFPEILNARWWGTSTPLYRRETSDAVGPWVSEFLYEDWEYEAKVGAMGFKYCYSEDYVVEVRHHDDHRLRNKKDDDYRFWLSQYARAHAAVYRAAKKAGVDKESTDMRKFVHTLIQLSNDCSKLGLNDTARMLLKFALFETLGTSHFGVFKLLADAYISTIRASGRDLMDRLVS